ncbi:MAG: hypothetical protein A2V79_06940 [Betaproteobacteria bacterium RBG_16_56_24]|nr:MAG: hypothetical protein A2V79_06940 [Betaproteobacteria bacterium RBG_16_56_24]
MNYKQKISLWAGAFNLAVLLLFPPTDSFSFTDTKALVFAGFHLIFTLSANEVINGDVLFLENVVLLVNVGVAWLLLRDGRYPPGVKRRFNFQDAILLVVAVNLTVILLFPPFEYYYAITKAPLPTFQGFYFIFMAGPMLAIVTSLLYLEVIFVLFNGSMLWLLFKRDEVKEPSPREAMELMRKISGKK